MLGSILDREVPRFTWRTVILVAAASPLTAVMLFFVLRADEASNWVQAIGAIGAIWAVVWATIFQQRAARAHEDERRAVIIKAVQVTAERAVKVTLKIHFAIRDIEKAEGQKAPKPGWQESASNALTSMKSINLLELPRAEMIEPVVAITRCLESTLMIYDGKQSNTGDRSGELYDLASTSLDQLKSL